MTFHSSCRQLLQDVNLAPGAWNETSDITLNDDAVQHEHALEK